MNRLDATLARLVDEGRGGLSIYWPLGYPDLETSRTCIETCIEAGADWLEIGLPFSDPAADGPVIQKATTEALAQGFTVDAGLGIAKQVRDAHPDVPMVAMTYANIAYQKGWSGFAEALRDAGLDGAILPDVPVEESAPVREALIAAGLDWIPLVAPTTPPERMQRIAETATGFLYVVAAVGITGQSDPGPLVEQTVERATGAGAKVPLAVGFGIGEEKDVRRVIDAGAQGAIVGTAAIRAFDEDGLEGLRRLVESLAKGVYGGAH